MTDAHKPLIAIIDDEEASCYALGYILKRNGYRVAEASTWADARAVIAGKPDLVILDVQLPDANGFEICRDLKNEPETQSIPILMTSASFVKSHDRAHGLNSGADGYLTTPIDPLELIATVRALLRIREAEEKLREAYEKAEAANAAKTAFLANMSHEIRTPMNVIMGIGEILARTELTDRQKECINTLQISARSLLDLISDVLDVARIENRKVDLEIVAFDVRKLMDSVMSMMAIKAGERKIGLAFDDDHLQGTYYTGDPTRLQQIVVNLVSNAVKFTAEGTVTVTIADDQPSAKGEPQVTIKVIDTGIGIAEEKLDVIFDKFTQGDISTTRKYGGTGLGLAISKSLAEKMGGAIAVSSVPGEGSVFTLSIPLKPADGADVRTEAVVDGKALKLKSAPKKKVLVVEDYPANILITTTFLEDLGYNYDTALNGHEALDKLNQGHYDAILMDIQMQGMDGYEAARRIRQKEDGKGRVPIIAMTAHALAGEAQKCQQAGMDDYISKPYRFSDLQNKLSQYIKSA